MSNIFQQLLGKSLEKELANSPEKNGLDAIMKNPLVKNMLKSYRKEITESLTKGEQDLITLIESIELLPGETQAAPIIDIDTDDNGNKEIRLIVAAFSNTELSRVISDIPLREFLLNWLQKTIK